jgi:hypothetical protein
VVTVISPLLVGCIWRGLTTKHPSNAATLLYTDTCRVSIDRGLAILVSHTRENKIEGKGLPTKGHSPMQKTLQ